MSPSSRNAVAIVLPPKERFAPAAAGAIGLLAARLTRFERQHRAYIVGNPCADTPFSGDFRPVRPCLWPVWSEAGRYARAVAQIIAADPPDLIEIHNRPELAPPLAMRFPTIPIALFLHNDPGRMRAIEEGAKVAARIVAVSDWVRDRLIQRIPGLQTDIAILPNCLDLAEMPTPLAPALREKLILFAGRVVADKGADLFVEACANALPLLPGWRAEMIGADRFGANSPETPFLRTLRPLAEKARVRLAGYQPHAAIMQAMSRAAIVAVPSRWPEPFGLTALEAMAGGGALICANTGALPGVVGNAARLIPPDVASLTEAILALANDLCERETLNQRGLRRAQDFDAPEAARALATLRHKTITG